MTRALSFFLTFFLCMVGSLHAQETVVPADSTENAFALLPDSSNFVTVSLMVATPGVEGYSALGHCALRLECPIHHLDYCFTFESRSDTPWFNYLSFLTANMSAGFTVAPTEAYINRFREEGRGMVQYPLNLKLHEEQELWRFLDTDWEQGAFRKFDFLRNNCTSVCLMAVENVMWQVEGEKMEVKQWPVPMTYDNGHGIIYLTRDAPWMQFLLMALVGVEAEAYWPQVERMSPELVGEVLLHASVMDAEGQVRPFVEGNPVKLLEQRLLPSHSPFTPNVVFASLLVLVLLITLAELLLHWERLPKWLDILLLTVQTLVGCFLLYISFVSNILGAHWNWLLLLFNPLPFLLWLLFHKKKNFYRIYLFYAAVLALIVVGGSFVSCQFLLANRLIAATLAVRCVAVYVKKVNKRTRP